jgi:hypothetical protein
VNDEARNLWSVTTLIKLGLGTSPALVNWAVRTTAEYAIDNQAAWAPLATADRDAAVKVLSDARWQKSGKAAARGSDVHRAAEQLALGVDADVEEHIFPYVQQYRRFLETHAPAFQMAEAPVYNLTQHYAGTTDGIMAIAGRVVIFDLKTTDKAPDAKTRPPYPEVALQLAAYSRAELVGLLSEKREFNYARYYVFDPAAHHEPMPVVDGAICIVISPFDCRVIPIRIDDEIFRAFLHVRECARWSVDTSRRVIGPEITAAARRETVA